MDKNLLKYLSTAPVLLTLWMSITAGGIIELQRFSLIHLRSKKVLVNSIAKSLLLFKLKAASIFFIFRKVFSDCYN